MIINSHYRFVFVHIPKVAGTSIQTALLTLPSSKSPPFATTKHHTSAEALAMADTSGLELRDYKFFAFVRNPWDRFVSLHRYLTMSYRDRWPIPSSVSEMSLMLDDKVEWLEQLHSIRPQSAFIGDDIFFLGRYEQLNDDFNHLCRSLGVELSLSRLNATVTCKTDYRSSYTVRAAEIISKRYRSDIEKFGYCFD